VKDGDTVAVFGCGPVGQLCIASALLLGAARVFAVDAVADRLEMAQAQGAEIVDFDMEDPVETIRELTSGIGVDRAIDAVGVDARAPRIRAGTEPAFADEVRTIAPQQHPHGDNFRPGDAPSQALDWAVRALDKAGTLGIVGVYPERATTFPIGIAMNKNLTLNAGNCHHRKYIPGLLRLVASRTFQPSRILTNRVSMADAVQAYRAFDNREPGWTKVELKTAA